MEVLRNEVIADIEGYLDSLTDVELPNYLSVEVCSKVFERYLKVVKKTNLRLTLRMYKVKSRNYFNKIQNHE